MAPTPALSGDARGQVFRRFSLDPGPERPRRKKYEKKACVIPQMGNTLHSIPRVRTQDRGLRFPVHSDLLFSKLKPPLGAAFLSAADRPVAGVRGQQHGSRRRDAKGRSGSGAAPRLYGTGGSPGAGGRHRSANADVPCQRSHLRRTVPADVAAERARHFRLQFAPATTAPRRSPRGGASDVTG